MNSYPKNIKFITSDGKEFLKDSKTFLISKLVEEVIVSEDNDEDNQIPDEAQIKLENIDCKTFLYIDKYCDHFSKPDNQPSEIEVPLKDDVKYSVSDFEKEFLESIDIKDLTPLIEAANFLNIESLLDLTTAKYAEILKNYTIKEIRELFNIEDDLTKQEKIAISNENQYLEGGVLYDENTM